MGYGSAVEMAAATDLRTALGWHLQSNHYPPLPAELVPVAERAVKAARKGDYDRRLRLPASVTWRGKRTAPVSACVEAWDLDAFIEAR